MIHKQSGECVARAECPECGSSDGVQIFEEKGGKRNAYCFACETNYPKVDGLKIITIKENNITDRKQHISMEEVGLLRPHGDRGIRADIMEAFGVKVGFSTSDPTKVAHHFYPSYSQTGELQGYDHRIVEPKSFGRVGQTKDSILFGQESCRSNKKLFVTEGHCDAMALYQTLLDLMAPSIRAKGYTPSVVSITNGASGAAKQLEQQSKFLSRFKEIILVFDNDKPGRNAAEKTAKALEHKVLIADLPLKDANEMLLEDRGKELQEATLYNAVPYEPDGIMNGKDTWERYKTRRETKSFPYPEQFKVLNEKTYGWRLGSVVTVTSGTGMGCENSPFMQQCMSKNLFNSGDLLAA